MNGKTWAIFIIIVVAVIGGMVYIATQNRLDVSNIGTEAAAKSLPAEERSGNIADHTFGSTAPKITIVEYGDYQCPGCRTTAPEVKRLTDKYKEHVQLIFRNFPIASLHPNARAAAAVAEAAGKQGKFWEMHDLLYTNQEVWGAAQLKDRTELFIGYAQQLGLNMDEFDRDVASDAVNKKISFDTAVGRLQQVDATPTLILNGEKLKLEDADGMEKAIRDALTKVGVTLPTEQ